MSESFYYRADIKGNYYKIELGEKKATYTPISESEFYKASGYNKSEVQALQKSVYPTQANDYLLLESEEGKVPVDYKLVPLVKLLWKKGFRTLGVNQPDEYNQGFVSVDAQTKQGKDSFESLQSLLKGFPFKHLDSKDKAPSALTLKRLQSKGILPLDDAGSFIAINVNDALLEKLYKHLHLKPNTKKLPGGIIIDESYFKLNKITKKR